MSADLTRHSFLMVVVFALYGFTTQLAVAVDWKIHSPYDGQEFPATTRSVTIWISKDTSTGATLRITRPNGNVQTYSLTNAAQKQLAALTISEAGQPLPEGEYVVELMDTATHVAHKIDFEIKDGDTSGPLPSVEWPYAGQKLPKSVKNLFVGGVASVQGWYKSTWASGTPITWSGTFTPQNNLWTVMITKPTGYTHYPTGIWHADVFAANPNLGGDYSDRNSFKIIDSTSWPDSSNGVGTRAQ